MAHAILISNNIMVNDLYSLNLKAYVDTDVTVKTQLDEAIQFIGMRPHLDLVICLAKMGGEDAIPILIKALDDAAIKVPLIVIGDYENKTDRDIYSLPPYLNLKKFIKTAGEALQITAKMMVEKVAPDYYPLKVAQLRVFSDSPCDIFHLVSKKGSQREYFKIMEAGSSIGGKITEYMNLNIDELYVLSQDRLKIIGEISANIIKRLDDKDLVVEDKAAIIELGFETIASQLSDNIEFNAEMVQISNRCVESLTEVMDEVPKIKNLIAMLLENKSGQIYQHNILGTFIAAHILNNIGWGSEEHLEKLRFTFFFHDIFLIPIYNKYPEASEEEELFFSDMLTEKEKELVVNHARLAGEMVKTFPRSPLGSDAIISQHHGTSNGIGIAIDYKDDISPLAKVMIVAESFVAEMLKQNNSGRKGYDQKAIMNILYDKFTRNTYKRMIKTLENVEL